MSNLKFPHLFEPITLGNVTFKNRIFGSCTSIHDLTEQNHYPTDVINAYYERKAIGGVASVGIGDATVDCVHGKAGAFHIPLDDFGAMGSLHNLANSISRHGAVAAMELQHAGMFSTGSADDGHEVWGPVAKTIERNSAIGIVETIDVLPMNDEMIQHTIDCYANAALLAKMAGYGMVVIHAGHGWLFSQFLSSKINTRTDEWGGASIENRMRFPLAVCDAIKKKCGRNFPVEVRISGDECFEGGYDFEEGKQIAKGFDGHVDLIHVSTGNHEDLDAFILTCPDMFHDPGCNVHYAADIKKIVDTPVATVGSLSDPELMEEIIASGKADVVEVARAIIADPDLPNKARAGKEDEVRECMRCLFCFSHLCTTNHICCAINPEIGTERESNYALPPRESQNVVIAGGGIGGMEAAIEAAKLGHKVTLVEKKDELGGALRCEREVPFKVNLDKYLNQQQQLCMDNPNIDVRLNTECTPEFAKSLNPDVIIAATGARPVKPPIPGIDGTNVQAAEDVYLDRSLAGKSVAILGGGLVGLELGIFLAMEGRKVSIVEMMPEVNFGGNILHGTGITLQIAKLGLDINTSSKALEITGEGVKVEDVNTGEQRLIAAETVIYAVGQRPQTEAALALYDCAPQFYMIGDCNAPKNIRQATNQAYHIVRDLGVIR